MSSIKSILKEYIMDFDDDTSDTFLENPCPVCNSNYSISTNSHPFQQFSCENGHTWHKKGTQKWIQLYKNVETGEVNFQIVQRLPYNLVY